MNRNTISNILSVLFYSIMSIAALLSAVLFYSLVDNTLWVIIITCCYIILFIGIIRNAYITLKYDNRD